MDPDSHLVGIIGIVLLILGVVPAGQTTDTQPNTVEPPANRLRSREKAGTEEEPFDID